MMTTDDQARFGTHWGCEMKGGEHVWRKWGDVLRCWCCQAVRSAQGKGEREGDSAEAKEQVN